MKTLKNIVKQSTYRERAVFLLTDAFLAALCTLGMQISFCGITWGTPEENYLIPVTMLTLVRFILFFLLGGVVLLALLYVNRVYTKRSTKEVTMRKFYFFSFVLLLLAWLPYVLIYFPGGVFSDTFASIDFAYSMDDYGMTMLNNHHPILYTLIWRGAILFGRLFHQGIFFATATMLILQYLTMAAVLAFLLFWVHRRGLGIKITLVLQIFLMFFPLYPLYVVSLWKDTFFALALLLFSLCVGDLVFDGADRLLRNPRYLIKFVILGFLTSFTRNNGKYIVFLTMAVLLLLQARRLLSHWRAVLAFVMLTTIVVVIQGPIYEKMNYNVDTTVESLGIPLQQLSYLVYYDYDFTEEEQAYIDSIISEESIKEWYHPCIVDPVKWNAPDFQGPIIEEDPLEFLQCWLSLMVHHPVGGIKAYLLATAGFWAPSVTSRDGYVQNWMWNNQYGLECTDLIEKFTGHTIRALTDSIEPVSSAVFFIILVLGAFVSLMRRDYRKLLLLLPAAGCWATVMIATPIACSLRYVYILVLAIPLDVLLICISGKRTYNQ